MISTNKPNEWEESIWITLCYYDALDYPLTELEIVKFLTINHQLNLLTDKTFLKHFSGKLPLLKVRKILRKSDYLKKRIAYQKGFYCFKGREGLINQRIEREKISSQKIKRLHRIFYWLKETPFLRAVIVTGRLALKNANPESDWDVLIVAKAGRIWTTRTLITILVWIIGKKRSEQKSKDKICLNYFITDKSLRISLQDLFSAQEYSAAFPLFDKQKTFLRFRQANDWIREIKPYYFEKEKMFRYCLKDDYLSYQIRRMIESVIDKLGGKNLLENWLASWQKEKIKRNPLTHLTGSLVKASDEELIFLPQPHGPIVFEKFMRRKISLE